ncbi:MAG: outer membrane protein assembly factor, partial [Pseudomonas sp.]|nr:outer membrane protein assembly factor [Pseudomonas sp.]
MSVLPNLVTGLLILLLSAAALAEAELRVRIEPANSALKRNIEGYIGSLGERDAEALQRFRRVAENQAEKASQALGYYQAQITAEVSEDATPRLTLHIQPGEPVRLRDVVVRIEGPAAQLGDFRLP